MMGATHRLIGIYTGILLAMLGVWGGASVWLVMAAMTPVGAMLPDIDHNSTKLGRKRKAAVGGAKKIAAVAAVLCLIAYITHEARVVGIASAVVKLVLAAAAICFLIFLATNPAVKKKLKFYTKHRGIMHTLAVPALLLYLALGVMEAEAATYAILGVAVGYMTHLLADCLTVGGCPFLWPLSYKPIHFTNVKTNTSGEKLMVVVTCTCITVIALAVSEIIL